MSADMQFTTERARENFAVAEHLVACYLSARAGLQQLGLLRSQRPLQGDYAEWIVKEHLKLELSPSTVEKDVDAKDLATGKQYQIKSRIVTDLSQNTSFDFRTGSMQFDYLIAVFFDPLLRLLAILQVPREVVQARSRQNASRVSFRWNRACADDPQIKCLFLREPVTVAPSVSTDCI